MLSQQQHFLISWHCTSWKAQETLVYALKGTLALWHMPRPAAFALSPESPVQLHLPWSCAANWDISYGWGFLALKVLFGENKSVVPAPQTIRLSHQSALAKQQKVPP